MTSTASSSTTASSSGATLPDSEESRFEAGPLPRKRGEIGFQEEIHGEAVAAASIQQPPPAVLPARHPADTDVPLVAPQEASTSSLPATTIVPSDASSTNSIVKRKGILHFLKPKKVPSYGGIRLTTFLAFVLQVCIIAGTIVGWALSVRAVMHGATIMQSDSDNNGPSASSSIFIHIVFGIAVLGQTLFLERRIFRLRAERYAFLHPGEMLPTSRRPHYSDPSIAFSPWNRPPLPTYAAALAQSGVGTGDVEDHIIAAPPPPAYGNTRGSTMLLTGFLRDSLRAQRPVSAQSQMSQQHAGRPVSYGLDDEEWEIIQDAERAIHLEEALTRLEGAPPEQARR